MFTNPIIVKQLLLALGLPFGLVFLFVFVVSGFSRDFLFFMYLMAALLLLAGLLIMVAYKGKYEVEYIVNDKGVRCRTQNRQRKQNSIINVLTMLLGIAQGKPSIAGIGMMAQARQDEFIKWNETTKITFQPARKIILIQGDWIQHMAVFCTTENYQIVKTMIEEKLIERRANYEAKT